MTRHTLVATAQASRAGAGQPGRRAGPDRQAEALRSTGASDEASLLDSFMTRFGDQIDDRVALAFDEQLAERLAEPGTFRRALLRDRRVGLALVCASLAMGTCLTILSPGGVTVLLIAWTAITVINLAYLLRRS